ncbi:MAG: carboxymuconolactone decarboxylase family protein [Bacilli bacterium]
MIIKPMDYERGSSEVKEAFDYQLRVNKNVTNMKKTLLHSLPAYNALMEWFPLKDELLKFISPRAFNLFCLSISQQNDCLVCSVYFIKILKDEGLNPATYQFDEVEDVLVNYGKAIVLDANNIDESIYIELQRLFNAEQIVVLTTFATIMIATNIFNKALKIDLDEYLVDYQGGF